MEAGGDGQSPVPDINNVPAIGDLEGPAQVNICSVCGAGPFKGKRGVGVHMASKHKNVVNAALPTPSINRTIWTDEELKQMAWTEASAVSLDLVAKSGVGSGINQYLLNALPGRTLDSIKSRRRVESYKQLVQSYLLNLQQQPHDNQPVHHRQTRKRNVISASSSSSSLRTSIGSMETIIDVNAPHNLLTDDDFTPMSSTEDDPMLALVHSHLLTLIKEPPNSNIYDRSHLVDIVRLALNKEDFMDSLNLYILSTFKGVKRRPRPYGPITKQQSKAATYARIQKLFRSNRKRCIESILNPGLTTGHMDFEFKEVHKFWDETFAPDDAPTLDGIEETASGWFEVFGPISAAEIKSNFPDLNKAAGPDNFTSRALRNIPLWHLECLFNLFILARDVPPCLKVAKTILIPKKAEPIGPGDYRPITLSPILLRHFHKVITSRLNSFITHHPHQRAFIEADGCNEASSVIYSIIKDAKSRRKRMHMAFLDVKKAFDSVEFRSIISAMASKGAPTSLQRYLFNLYTGSTTTLSTNNGSATIKPTRGVRQGDPLSPILFNSIIDNVLEALPSRTGYTFKTSTSSTSINSLAFADDLVLIAHTQNGLQELINIAVGVLHKAGLSLNPAKCKTLSILPLGKQKKTKVAEIPFKVDSSIIPSTDIDETITYLGLPINCTGSPSPYILYNKYCKLLSCSPLKPHQRLFALKYHIIPKLMHPLVLSDLPIYKIRGLDILTRNYVRKWLHLPHDFPIGILHAKTSIGGLGIPRLITMVAWNKISRRSKLQHHPLDIFRLIGNLSFVQDDIKNCRKLLMKTLRCPPSEESLAAYEMAQLNATSDGQSLKEAHKVPAAHDWVHWYDKKGHLAGRDYIGMIHSRYNCLPTRCRVWRGRGAQPQHLKCRAGCGANETLGHIAQICPRTHNIRVKRHDRILDFICKRLGEVGWSVEREKRYQLSGHIMIPDITMTRSGTHNIVLDLQVVGDSDKDMDSRSRMKISKYANDEELKSRLYKDGIPPQFGAITVQYKGMIAPDSYNMLKGFGLKRQDFNIMASSALYGTYATWGVFNRSTSAGGRGNIWSPTGE